jgi:hypothetical protein
VKENVPPFEQEAGGLRDSLDDLTTGTFLASASNHPAQCPVTTPSLSFMYAIYKTSVPPHSKHTWSALQTDHLNCMHSEVMQSGWVLKRVVYIFITELYRIYTIYAIYTIYTIYTTYTIYTISYVLTKKNSTNETECLQFKIFHISNCLPDYIDYIAYISYLTLLGRLY